MNSYIIRVEHKGYRGRVHKNAFVVRGYKWAVATAKECAERSDNISTILERPHRGDSIDYTAVK